MRLREIERAWRVGWMRSIGALSAGDAVASVPEWSNRPWSVLYMRTQGIGDLILATGVLRAIAQAQPNVVIDVLAKSPATPVLDGNPHVRRVHTLASGALGTARMVRDLRAAKYDVVIDGKISRGASFVKWPAITLASRAPYRIGVDGGNHRLVYNLCVDRFDRTTTHMVEGSAALAAPFGVDLATTNFRPEIFLSELERRRAEREWGGAQTLPNGDRRRWLVNISAGTTEKRWPAEQWARFARALRARAQGDTIVVIGSPAEWTAVTAVAEAAGAAPVATPQLRDALALVGTSSHVITSDTSITHAASAFRIPTLVFLREGLTQWSPWNTPSAIAYWSGTSVSSLTVEAACAALHELLELQE